MDKNKRFLTLSCVFLIIILILFMTFAFTSCRKNKNPDANSENTGEVTESSSQDEKDIKVPIERNSGKEISSSVSVKTGNDLSEYSSVNGVFVSENGFAFVSDETQKKVYKINPSGQTLLTYKSDYCVNGLSLYENVLYVLEGQLNGRLVKLDGYFKESSYVIVGHTPEDVAFYNGYAYVANRFSGTVSVIRLSDMTKISDIKINGREPNCLAVTGNFLYVGCHLTDDNSIGDISSSKVCVIDLSNNALIKTIPLCNGSSSVKDMCVSPDGERIYVSHVIGRYTYPTTQLDRGWINTNGFSIIDTKSQTLYSTILIDEVDKGAANPWGITVSSDGKNLCVSASGTNEVIFVDIEKMDSRLAKVGKIGGLVESLDKVVDYIPFLADIETRVTVGNGVREIFSRNGFIYCGLYFDGAVSKIDENTKDVSDFVRFDQPEPDDERAGMILWSDANKCYQKWESCNSCHPDGIVDGFNWDNLNDGIGNSKSAKSMLYSHRTPPVMVTGIRPNAETAVGAGMKFIQFNLLSSEELSKIDTYLKSLYPIDSPSRTEEGILSESALSGKEIFENNCASCHPAPLYTDMKLHNVGTQTPNDPEEFDTPTLVEVWRTAPYMHDGSFKTLEEAVRYFARDLSDEQIKNLTDYVSSIDLLLEDYGIEQMHIEYEGKDMYNVYKAGAQIKYYTLRLQKKGAKRAAVSLNVYSKDGDVIYYSDKTLDSIPYNKEVTITLDEPIVLPEGGYVSIEFYYEDSSKAATPIVFR